MEAEISGEIDAGRGEVCARAGNPSKRLPAPGLGDAGRRDRAARSAQTLGRGLLPLLPGAAPAAEQAIVSVVMEAYINGVSTRKADRIVEELGISGISKDRVLALCRGLDERVAAFRERPLEGTYPYLWLDAKQLKVRSGDHVRSKALVVANPQLFALLVPGEVSRVVLRGPAPSG